MPRWELKDPRAVVPAPALETTRDVMCPSLKHCHTSPSPLGLGLYSSRPDDSPLAALPLFYVSPRAAADRSPARDMNNAPGVKAGWYAVAAPGLPFEVRVTRVNKQIPGDVKENQITSRLLMDGVNTNNPEAFHIDGDLYDERVAMGFVERYETSPDGGLERKVRRFAFRKANATEGDGEGNAEGCGSIRLEACVGQAVLREGVTLQGQYEYSGEGKVSEKEVAKEGKSIGVRRDGVKMMQTRTIAKHRTICEREVPEVTVTLFVREQSWMRSRRLVDDWGQPCTYEMYKALLKKDSGEAAPPVERIQRPRKRARRTPVVIDLDKEEKKKEPVVIDLENSNAVVDLT